MTQIDQARLAQVLALPLKSGAHKSLDDGMCIMEACAYVAGEEWSDSPKCADPGIAAAMRRFNDRLPTDAMRTEFLAPLIPELVGSAAPMDVRIKRAFVAADFACRVFFPMYLDARGDKEEAARQRNAEPITSKSSAEQARDRIKATKYYAAADAADAAYAYAAYAAADAAAAHAAAAYAAAAYAAWRLIAPEFVRMIRAMLAIRE